MRTWSSAGSFGRTGSFSVTFDMSYASPNLYSYVIRTLHNGQDDEYYVHDTMHSKQKRCEQPLGFVLSETDSRQILHIFSSATKLRRGFIGLLSIFPVNGIPAVRGIRLSRRRFFLDSEISA